jgi:DNA-binding LytR/AlgR family response regulator
LHRSYIVNLDFVQAIVPLESGEAVPVRRRYRDALKRTC